MLAAQPIIAEFMADNENGLRDGDGRRSDWIEIQNAGDAPVDLAGWHLTDLATRLDRWTFPSAIATTLLDAGESLLVFASGQPTEDHVDFAGYLHTNFRLDADGEYLALVDDQLNVVQEFSPNYPEQFDDISYGPAAPAGQPLYYVDSTPGDPNGAGFVDVTRDKVNFSRSGGTFTGSFDLQLSTDAVGGAIHYTLDGTLPTEASPTYAGPIAIGPTTQVRALVIQPDFAPGRVKTEAFVRLGADVVEFSSQLPIMVIENFGGGRIPNSGWNQTNSGIVQVRRQPASLMLFEPEAGQSRLAAPADLSSRIGIRVRGSASSGFTEPGYSLESWSDGSDRDDDIRPFGIAAESDWVLYAPSPSSDITLMDNSFSFKISNQMGHWAPEIQYVETFVNQNGGVVTMADFVGLYVFTEKVKRGDDRLEFDRFAGDGSSGGWLLDINRKDSIPEDGIGTPQFFHTPGPNGVLQTPANTSGVGDDIPRQYNAFINFDDPGGYEINPTQRQTIEGWFADMEDVLFGRTAVAWNDPIEGYPKYIDVDDFIDYFIVHNLSRNGDGLLISMWVYNPDPNGAGKLAMGPIWDTDLGGYQGTPTSDLLRRSDRLWYGRMFQDPNFMQRYIDRWQEFRSGVLSDQNMFDLIDSISTAVGNDAAVRDAVSDWPSRLQNMKNWLAARAGAIDSLYLARPDFNQSGGHVSEGFGLTISAPSGTIYYTTDGSDPRTSDGNPGESARIYSGSPIAILKETTVRARLKSGNNWSGETSAVFSLFVPADVTNLTLSEIHYNPADPPAPEMTDSDQFEFIEIHNFGPQTVDLNGVHFSDGIQFDFTGSNVTSLASGGYAVVVSNREAFLSRYSGFDTSKFAGEFAPSNLRNGGEKVVLVNSSGEVIAALNYKDSWHALSDGDGFSLTRIDATDPSADLSNQNTWRPSSLVHGSPGADDPRLLPDPGQLIINELLAHTDQAGGDWVELHNTTGDDIEVGGWFLSDDPTTFRKYRIAEGTTVPADGFLVLDEQTNFGTATADPGALLPFAFSELGDEVVLQAANPTSGALLGFASRRIFGASPRDETFGHVLKSDGGDDFTALIAPTRDSTNTSPRVGPIVIEEIMYHPAAGGEEFIELLNISGEAVPLFDLAHPTNTWAFTSGISFAFPPDVTLPAGALALVVPSDPDAFRVAHNVPAEVPIFGPYLSSLNNAGEKIELSRPGEPNPDDFVPMIAVDRVTYNDKAPWPTQADGLGWSLQRKASDEYGNDPINWSVTVQGGTPGSLVIAPRVEEVFVSGRGWSPKALQRLADDGLGALGFSIPAGAAQLQTIAWTGIDRLSIRFSEDVNVSQDDLRLFGTNVSEYEVDGFGYDDRPDSYTATWTLRDPIGGDRLRLELSDEVTDDSGLPLDGNWIDAASSFPSGNGAIDTALDDGDTLRFRFDILPGDVGVGGRVERSDLFAVIGALGSDTDRPDYDARLDIDLDGNIDLIDLRAVLLRQGSRLPSAEPHAAGDPLPRVAVDEVFQRMGQAAAAQAAIRRSTTTRRARHVASSSPTATESNRPLRRLQAATVERAMVEQSESTLVRRTSAFARRRR